MPPLSKRQKAARKRARADAGGFAANVAEAPATKQLPMVVGWNPVTKAISGQLLLLPCTDGWFGAGSDAGGELTDSSDSDSGGPGGEAAVPATERIAAARRRCSQSNRTKAGATTGGQSGSGEATRGPSCGATGLLRRPRQ